MFNEIAGVFGHRLSKAVLVGKKYSPELYLTAGIVAGVASTVMLMRAHKKFEEEIYEEVQDYNEEKAQMEADEDNTGLEYTTGAKFERLAPHIRAISLKTIQIYAPGVLMGGCALGFVVASHGVLRGRNRALMATAAVLQQGLNQYRKRVREAYGDEAEKKLWLGSETRKVVELEVDENGKATKRKREKEHIPEEITPLIYQRIFDHTNHNWSPDDELNEFKLAAVQNMFNDRLKIWGVVMLNDVYDELGFERSPYAQLVGWSKFSNGDGYVDFGIDAEVNHNRDDKRWILDFNVDGPVWEDIGRKD